MEEKREDRKHERMAEGLTEIFTHLVNEGLVSESLFYIWRVKPKEAKCLKL